MKKIRGNAPFLFVYRWMQKKYWKGSAQSHEQLESARGRPRSGNGAKYEQYVPKFNTNVLSKRIIGRCTSVEVRTIFARALSMKPSIQKYPPPPWKKKSFIHFPTPWKERLWRTLHETRKERQRRSWRVSLRATLYWEVKVHRSKILSNIILQVAEFYGCEMEIKSSFQLALWLEDRRVDRQMDFEILQK